MAALAGIVLPDMFCRPVLITHTYSTNVASVLVLIARQGSLLCVFVVRVPRLTSPYHASPYDYYTAPRLGHVVREHMTSPLRSVLLELLNLRSAVAALA